LFIYVFSEILSYLFGRRIRIRLAIVLSVPLGLLPL